MSLFLFFFLLFFKVFSTLCGLVFFFLQKVSKHTPALCKVLPYDSDLCSFLFCEPTGPNGSPLSRRLMLFFWRREGIITAAEILAQACYPFSPFRHPPPAPPPFPQRPATEYISIVRSCCPLLAQTRDNHGRLFVDAGYRVGCRCLAGCILSAREGWVRLRR